MEERKNFKHLDTIAALFVAVLLISNVASSKIVKIWLFEFDGGTLLFPLSYIFGDILTEIYGFKRSRKVIWLGFFSAGLMSAIFAIVAFLKPAPGWENQQAFIAILGQTPRIVVASLIAYFSGEYSNSVILAIMKVKTKGKHLWTRTIGSTIVGEFVDTILFVLIAFSFTMPWSTLRNVIISNYVFKVGIEVLFTPITYLIVNKLKKIEDFDYYDKDTIFSPV
ncbi:MAG: queuosine precursor transporter [Spirochaetales bacterium]|nr:queuosine precursor transporter [Spirochaetales bacterium]